MAVGNEQVDNEEFVVIEGKGQSLLGRETVLSLNVLKLGPSVNAVNETDIMNRYPEVTNGLGKLKNFELKIPLDGLHQLYKMFDVFPTSCGLR